ncbi:DOPA 4,5-dioxygenase family protein [Comamonas endophytica]|uniref:DOPA 4,5-dioxygenase family protein n=1 Tax=Comamonas endophytica TaxID=2949090 RepID=A0ABY6GE77_9BURK|nr:MULTISPECIES: DOPA 4,5-dioxygenase family protein [unclassified Acidovorax]MCD2513239.1 DOPA 4,5-dioxygenase family protein [Acidovorax sp. D4N7]UYG53416.1 DOPA 4,5-dioxygenase family protein [Acidovorax sp. 5MLIR]
MSALISTAIHDWHAHVYFDAASRAPAWALREAIGQHLAAQVEIGRFHEKPVGPHPMWSFQLRIQSQDFLSVLEWLVLHHGMLDVFVHPNTGDGLRDHRDHALWIGKSHILDLALFGAKN